MLLEAIWIGLIIYVPRKYSEADYLVINEIDRPWGVAGEGDAGDRDSTGVLVTYNMLHTIVRLTTNCGSFPVKTAAVANTLPDFENHRDLNDPRNSNHLSIPSFKMVKTAEVVAANSRFASEHHEGRVCVFAGATSGIGLGALRRLAKMLYSSTFYILGRSESKFTSELESLRSSAPTCKFVFIEAQVSLIRSIDEASKCIISMDKKIDILCISPGGMPFQGEIRT